MKYTINSNSIDVEYIANGKRKQLKLQNNDEIDMDFFNQLIAAKPNKRDAMCELYRRKILKESDEDTVHIQPLKLDKEIKPSKYAEKQELNRRKEELERDKNGIKGEINVLVKDDAKNKDVKSLTKTDLNDEHDEAKLKELQRKYMEIDKIHQMIVNQIDSLEINTADSVNIKELKNLTVNAFENINKSLVDAKITEQDKEDIADKISNVIVPRFNNLNQLVNRFSKITMNYIKETNAKSKEEREQFIEQYKQDFDELAKDIKDQIADLPKDNSVDDVIQLINEMSTSLEDIPTIQEKLGELEQAIVNLPTVFDHPTIEKREITLNELVDALKQNQDILDQQITSELVDKIKSNLPNLNPTTTNLDVFRNTMYNKSQGTSTKWQSFTSKTIKQHSNLAFWYNDDLYIINPYNTKIFPINTEDVEFWDVQFEKYNINDIANLTIGDLMDHTTLQEQRNYTLINHKPNIYIKTEIGLRTDNISGKSTTYPQFILFKGNKEFIELLKAIQKNKPKSDGLNGINAINGNGGRIMIDLNKSTTDEKLNEIIRLLSQMNYNIFTTTPMYKNNRYTKSPKQNQNQKNTAKGIDLYDVLDL